MNASLGGRYAVGARGEAWAYVCGVCAARETAFLQPRTIEELGGLAAGEVVQRLARTFMGTVESLSDFDRVAQRRQSAELADILALSPSPLPVDLMRVREGAERMRAGLGELPPRLDAASFAQALRDLSIRSGDFAAEFAALFSRTWSDPGPEARAAASLVIDGAELEVVQALASVADDPVVEKWAGYRVGEGTARVADRALKLGISRDMLADYFFRDALMSRKARDFLMDFNAQAAAAMYPEGVTPDNVEQRMLAVTAESTGNPFSAGRVVHYLQLFADQIRRVRLAVYEATGRIRKEAA